MPALSTNLDKQTRAGELWLLGFSGPLQGSSRRRAISPCEVDIGSHQAELHSARRS